MGDYNGSPSARHFKRPYRSPAHILSITNFVRPVKLNENRYRFMLFLWCFSISDINKAPTANGGPDVLVYLPNRAAELDGSQSYDDHGIVEYEWSRDPKSPAAGVSAM